MTFCKYEKLFSQSNDDNDNKIKDDNNITTNNAYTLESLIIGGVGIIRGEVGGKVDIVIIINNRGVGRSWKNSAGGFLVLIC